MELHLSVAKVMLLLFLFEIIGFLLAYSGIAAQKTIPITNMTASLNTTTNNLVGAFNYTIIAPQAASGSWLPSWLYDGFAWFVNGVAKVVDIIIQVGLLVVNVIYDFLLLFYVVMPSILLSANIGMFGFIFFAGYAILIAYISFYLALGIYYLISALVSGIMGLI
ncbi:MAG: hypothetical protein ACP5LI_05935 [Hydrogenobaculum sp.]